MKMMKMRIKDAAMKADINNNNNNYDNNNYDNNNYDPDYFDYALISKHNKEVYSVIKNIRSLLAHVNFYDKLDGFTLDLCSKMLNTLINFLEEKNFIYYDIAGDPVKSKSKE